MYYRNISNGMSPVTNMASSAISSPIMNARNSNNKSIHSDNNENHNVHNRQSAVSAVATTVSMTTAQPTLPIVQAHSIQSEEFRQHYHQPQQQQQQQPSLIRRRGRMQMMTVNTAFSSSDAAKCPSLHFISAASSISSSSSTRNEDLEAIQILRQHEQQRQRPPQQQQPQHQSDDDRDEDAKSVREQEKQQHSKEQTRRDRTRGNREEISVTSLHLNTPTVASPASSLSSPIPDDIYQAILKGQSNSLSLPGNLDFLRLSQQQNQEASGRLQLPLCKKTIHKNSNNVDMRNSSNASLVLPKDDQADDDEEQQPLDGEAEMAFYRLVSKHTILQIVTEDMLSDNRKLVAYGLYRLCELCCNDNNTNNDDKTTASDHRMRFVKAGGHGILVGVMKKFAKSRDVQTSACRFVQNMILSDPESPFVELFSSVNGLDVVLRSLACSDEEVRRYASGALISLVLAEPKKMIPRFMEEYPNFLGKFLQHTQQHHQLSATSYVKSSFGGALGLCQMISCIAAYPQYHAHLIRSGGIEALMTAMQREENESVVEVFIVGFTALGYLLAAEQHWVEKRQHRTSSSVNDNHFCVAEVIMNDLDGAPLICSAIKKFSNSEHLQERAIAVLYHCSQWKKASLVIKQAGGLSAVGIALENFPQNANIQKMGYATMKFLLDSGRMSPVPE
jgi:hypothetical protein